MASSQQFANRQYGASQQQGSAPMRNNKQMFSQTMAPPVPREKRERSQRQDSGQAKLALKDLTDEQRDEINEAVS